MKANSAERHERILDLARQGLDNATIADKLKISSRTVARAKACAGIAKPPRRASEDDKLKAKILLHDGASYQEVSRTIGWDGETIANWHPGFTFTKRQTGQASALSRRMRELEKLNHLEKIR